jgi:hypothetical protein
MWDFKFSRRRVSCSELSSGIIPDDGRTSETSVDNHFTRQYIPEDNSEQQSKDVWLRAAEENIWTQEGWRYIAVEQIYGGGFIIYIRHQILTGWLNWGGLGDLDV